MYHFRLADFDAVEKISNIKRFDLNLNEKPRFFVMTKDDEILSFALVVKKENYNYIEYIYENNLTEDEIDFFYRSLVYLIGDEGDLYSGYKHEFYVSPIEVDTGLYKVEIQKGPKCSGK